MKTIFKKMMCVLMMACCLITGLAFDTTLVKAEAVSGGSISLGQQITISFDAAKAYKYSLTTTEKGMLVLNMSLANSVNAGNGNDYADISVNIYDLQGKLQWTTINYESQLEAGETGIINKIGLNAGNYELEIIGGSDSCGNITLTTDFIQDEFVEVCPNGNKENATVIELNNMYSGVYGEGNYASNYNGCQDYFAVSLTKGKCYRICLENFDKLMEKAAIYFENPNGDIKCSENDFYGKGYTKYYDFKAEYTGTYYIYLDLYSGGRGIDYKVGVMNIDVKAPVLKSLTAGKASFTAKYDAVEGANGYEIQCSVNKNFKKSKIVNVKKQSIVSKKITKLKNNKKYYVRVRAYKVIDSKKIYSKWSNVKNVKVK